MAALWLDERVTEGNEKLRELHAAALAGNKEKSIPSSKVMTPLHASGVKWAMRGWLRKTLTLRRGGMAEAMAPLAGVPLSAVATIASS